MSKSNIIFFSLLFSLNSYSQSSIEVKEQVKRKPVAINKMEASFMLKKFREIWAPKKIDTKVLKNITNNTTEIYSSQYDKKLFDACNLDEEQFNKLDYYFFEKWKKSFIDQNSQEFSKLFAKDFLFSFPNEKIPSAKLDNIDEYDWRNNVEINQPGAMEKKLSEYFSQFSKIVDVELIATKYEILNKDRSQDLKFKKMKVYFDYNLIGMSGNSRRVDSGKLRVLIASESEKIENFKILKLSFDNLKTLTNSKPSFKEVTASSGLSQMTAYPRIEAIRRGGYALAVGDYDNDGVQDMLVGAYGTSKLFKGKSDGTFGEAMDTGIGQHTYVKSAIWADLNNDGWQDLILVRFVPAQVDFNNSKGIIVYENTGGGKFREKHNVFPIEKTDFAMPAALADFNQDGLLDLYIGYPGSKDFSALNVNFNYKKNLKAQGVYINKGNFEFSSELMNKFKKERGMGFENFNDKQKLFPHSSIAADLNQDGKVDLAIIDDRGNLSPIYLNDGSSNFSLGNNDLNLFNFGFGMGAIASDYNNDGFVDLFTTNVKFAAKDRYSASCQANWGVSSDRDSFLKNDIKVFTAKMIDGKKKFEETSPASIGIASVGDGLGAIESIDYNNDGCEDFYVVNGLWSGTSKKDDLASEFSRLDNLTLRLSSYIRETSDATQSSIMKILSNFKGDKFGKNPDSVTRLSLGGFQRNKLFRNNCNGTFTEVGFLEGVDSIADGYVIAKADIDNSGRQSLILRNADPGTLDVNFSPVQIYKNIFEGNNFLRLKLIGSKGNRDSIGAEVKVDVNESLTLTKQLIGNAGTSQSEKVLHFGLGKNTVAKSITIKWPTGKTSILNNVKAGLVEIQEERPNQINYVTQN